MSEQTAISQRIAPARPIRLGSLEKDLLVSAQDTGRLAGLLSSFDRRAKEAVERLIEKRMVVQVNAILSLTDAGQARASAEKRMIAARRAAALTP